MTTQPSSAEADQPAAILIVDDEYAIRFSLESYFNDHGFAASSAGTAEEAQQLLDQHRFALVLIDLRLPGASGESLICRVASRQPQLRFLIYTGSAGYRLSPALRRAGLSDSDVLIKPVADLRELRALVASKIGAQR